LEFTVRNKRQRKKFNIFIIQTFKEFEIIYDKIDANVFKFNGFYLLVLVNGEIPEIQKIFSLMWKKQIFNVDVVFKDQSNEVYVKTFMPFNEKKCNDTTPMTIRNYQQGKFKQNVTNIFPKKVKNMYRCYIRTSFSTSDEPFWFVKNHDNGSQILGGESFEIISTLSKVLNFRVNFTYTGKDGFLLENGTAEGTFKAMLDGVIDLTISDWWLKENRLKFLDASTFYLTEKVIIVIPLRSCRCLKSFVIHFKQLRGYLLSSTLL
jgi:hypothetical protein